MKAILALSARYLVLNPSGELEPQRSRTLAIEFYLDTLRWLRNAMKCESFGYSPELIATALILSTYEMLDEVGKPWEKHLEGIFWIQRSLDNSGECEGLRQAVWWAWLRQDVWAAFREGRKCFTFFKPRRPYDQLNQYEVANRSVYLLSQVINYTSGGEKLTRKDNFQNRALEGHRLRDLLEEWSENLRLHFSPLPLASADPNSLFEPMWIRPSEFAVAIQMNCFARILLLLHSPSQDIQESRKREKEISDLGTTICRVAITLQSHDPALLISTQCVFVAGLYCNEPRKRDAICQILKCHQENIGWPEEELCDELHERWMDDDQEIS